MAAKPALPGRQRRRPRASRLAQYALVQVLIAIACVFVLHQSLPQPPAGYLVNAFNTKEGGTERGVTLPHRAGLSDNGDRRGVRTGGRRHRPPAAGPTRRRRRQARDPCRPVCRAVQSQKYLVVAE